MKDKQSEIVRIGKVSSINEDNCSARVCFSDRENIVSDELPIIAPFTLNDKSYYMPSINERVVCIFLPNAPSRGFIVGSFYVDARKPAIKDKNKFYAKFEDETVIEYDKQKHTMTVEILQTGITSISIFAASDINVTTNGNVTIKSANNVSIQSGGNIEINAAGTMKIESGGNMLLKAPRIDFNEED